MNEHGDMAWFEFVDQYPEAAKKFRVWAAANASPYPSDPEAWVFRYEHDYGYLAAWPPGEHEDVAEYQLPESGAAAKYLEEWAWGYH